MSSSSYAWGGGVFGKPLDVTVWLLAILRGIMNVYDISQTQDPTKTYSKTIDESKCEDFDDFIQKVEDQRHKLQCGIFAFQGGFYFARFKEKDQTIREHDPIVNMTTTICRKIKFKWEYIFLK